MTLVGKLFVMVNVFLSLGMMALGIGLYTTRINWTDKETAGEPPAEMKKRKDRLAAQFSTLATAAARQANAEKLLVAVEDQRRRNEAWYNAELFHIQYTASEQQPARTAVLQGGVTVPGGPNNPAPILMENAVERSDGKTGPPDVLRSSAAYRDDLEKIDGKIKEAMAQLSAENKKAEEKGAVLVNKEVNKEIKPGLRQLVEDEQNKGDRVLAEQNRLRPLLVNAYVEIQLLAKRHEQLEKQVEALKAKLSR
jgi:hypothetical protein